MRVLMLLLAASSSSALPRDGIVTGTRAGPSDVRATVALFHQGASRPFCTGTAIGLRLVLTAAHCVTEDYEGVTYLLDPANLLVFAGTVDGRSRSAFNEHAVTQLIVHPGYDPRTLRDDVALMVLASPVSLTVARVPDEEEALSFVTEGAFVTVQGYGLTNPNDNDSGGVLHFAQLPFEKITGNDLLHAGNAASSDVCFGDSGGPAYANGADEWLVVGVTSATKTDLGRACDRGGLFAWTPAYKGWIEETGGPLVGLPPPGSAGDGGCASRPTGLVALVLLMALRWRRR